MEQAHNGVRSLSTALVAGAALLAGCSGLSTDLQGEQGVPPSSMENDPAFHARLRELAAQAGGKLKLFPSSKEYFAELFDPGENAVEFGDHRLKLGLGHLDPGEGGNLGHGCGIDRHGVPSCVTGSAAR